MAKKTFLFNVKDKKKLNNNEDKHNIIKAAKIISDGGLVAFPTETVYGLGANALDSNAVKKIYEAKGRPSDNPMIVHISKKEDIEKVILEVSPIAEKLIENFWPGPLTLVAKKNKNVPKETTGGLETVAVRMPDNIIALELIRQAGCPIAAPSANISGRPSPTKASHVIEDLEGIIDGILIGEDCRVGIESTVLDISGEIPTILRPGTITLENIKEKIAGDAIYHPSLIEKSSKEEDIINTNLAEISPKSPGMKYKHYAPEAEMIVIEGRRDKVLIEIERLKEENEAAGLQVGVILFEEKASIEAANQFYGQVRELDKKKVDLIVAGALSDKDGIGFAVMNRMIKAAGYNIVSV